MSSNGRLTDIGDLLELGTGEIELILDGPSDFDEGGLTTASTLPTQLLEHLVLEIRDIHLG